MSVSFWPKEHKELFKRMAESGAMADDIMKIFPGRTRGSIRNMATELGVSLSGGKAEMDINAFKEFMKGRGR